MHETTLNKMISSRVVAVVRKVDSNRINELVRSLVTGGVTGIEITMDSENALEKINELKLEFNDQAAIGAGTVVNKKQAEEAINAGADFIFAPTLDRETIEYTKQKGKVMIPGAFTPTEIYQGYVWGADIIKVFPASVLGSEFIKDVKGPLSDIPLMPTGGISLDNIKDFIEAGCVAAGVGGSLVKKDLINEGDWEQLENLARSFVDNALKVKNNELRESVRHL